MKKIFIIPFLSILCVAGCSKHDETSKSTSNIVLTTHVTPPGGSSNEASNPQASSNARNRHSLRLISSGNLSLSRLQEGLPTNPISFNEYGPYIESTEPFISTHDVDNEETESLTTNGGSNTVFNKSTFYLHNESTENVDYSFKISIQYNKNKNLMSNIMRIRLFKNDVEASSHNFETYAKSSAGGGPERISDSESNYATEFISDEVAMNDESLIINAGSTIRYTLVAWLEGEDPEATGATTTGVFELSVEIKEYSTE